MIGFVSSVFNSGCYPTAGPHVALLKDTQRLIS